MILVDTQTVIWLAAEPEKVSRTAADAIEGARKVDGIAISDKTLWELAMAHSKKRIESTVSLREFLEEIERTFNVLPINAAIAERSVQFGKSFPADPSDSIIAATAIVYELSLVTSDALIRKSGEVDCIW